MKDALVLFAAIGFVFTPDARAQDGNNNCIAILQYAAYDEVAVAISSLEHTYQKSDMCASYTQESTRGVKGSATSVYEGVTASLGLDTSRTSEVAQALCSSSVSQTVSAFNKETLERMVSPASLDAYNSCNTLSTAGLKVSFKKYGDRVFTTTVQWAGTGPAHLTGMIKYGDFACSGPFFDMMAVATTAKPVRIESEKKYQMSCIRGAAGNQTLLTAEPGQLVFSDLAILAMTDVSADPLTFVLDAVVAPKPLPRLANRYELVAVGEGCNHSDRCGGGKASWIRFTDDGQRSTYVDALTCSDIGAWQPWRGLTIQCGIDWENGQPYLVGRYATTDRHCGGQSGWTAERTPLGKSGDATLTLATTGHRATCTAKDLDAGAQ